MTPRPHRPVRTLAARTAPLLGAWLALLACGSPPVRPGPLPGPALVTTAEPYRLKPGDELELRFFHTPELDVTLPVRPDGSISIPLVHEVRVAGRTVEEVRLELTERYTQELADPELVVIVRGFARYAVHVGGEVTRPGVLELSGPRTVLEAVLAAGGWLPTARLAEVVVVRRQESGGHELVTADLRAVLAGRDGRANFALRPWDVVFVPSSPIADVNRWVDLYIRQNIPISFSYRLDTSD